MAKREITDEEIKKSLDFLKTIGTTPSGQEDANGGQEKKMELLKAEFQEHIEKAKCIADEMEKLKKATVAPEEGKEEEENESEKENKEAEKVEAGKKTTMKKSNESDVISKQEVEELRKSLMDEFSSQLGSYKEEVNEIMKSKDDEINSLKDKLEYFESQPIQKSIRPGSVEYIRKSFEVAENDGLKPLSKQMQKSLVSNALFEAFSTEEDSLMKGKLSEAVSTFEAGNGFIPEDVIAYMKAKHKIAIV
jgi:hypothetical protein